MNSIAEITRIEQETKELIDNLKRTCASHGLSNDGNEYKIITQVFLYKYFNDKFGYEAKRVAGGGYGARLSAADKWDAEYDKFTEDEVEDLFSYLPSGTPRLKPCHTISHLYNAQQQGDFSTLFDATMVDIANLNAGIFSMATVGDTKLTIFENITVFVPDVQQRDQFAVSLMKNIAGFNFEKVFIQKYDFFSTIFEYLIKDYNKDGGGVYAEYYTPKAVASIMARLLVPENSDLHSVTCYDPSAGSGTLLMALAHAIGEDRCQIYSQDISQKSSKMLRLNLILNNLVGSIQNIIQGDTLVSPKHKEANGSLRKFDYIVSNPPFKLDFSDSRDTIAEDTLRFWAGVPSIPKKDKKGMAIYLCFLQHIVYSLKETGKAAIVVPTGFITAKSGVEKKILQKLVDGRMLSGVVSMPSNIFANTGTNVSVLFIDRTNTDGKVVLMDASKLGTTIKDDGNQKTLLSEADIDKIITTFHAKEPVEDFAVAVTYEEIVEKGYSLSAGQYFDIKIDYVAITEEEFNQRMNNYKQTLTEQFAESHRLEDEIMAQLDSLKFNE